MTALLDPKQSCPGLELLPTKALNPQLLHFAPKDAAVAAAIDNSDGEKRFRHFVTIADALSPRDKFSDQLKQMETSLGVDFAKDIFGQVSTVGFAFGDPMKIRIKTVEEIGRDYHRISSGPEHLPLVFILQTVDEKAAANLIKLAPKLVAGGKEPMAPVTRTVEGREIFVLKMGREELCYGREGTTLVVGPDAGTVAKSLSSGAKKQGLLSVPQIAGRLAEIKDRQAVLFVKPSVTMASLGWSSYGGKATVGDKKTDPDFKDKEPVKPEIKVTYRSPMDEPLMKQMSEIFSKEEFAMVSLLNTKEKLQLDGSAAGLRPIVSGLIDIFVDDMYQRQARDRQRFDENRRKDEERFKK
jgi:hypothetical protein